MATTSKSASVIVQVLIVCTSMCCVCVYVCSDRVYDTEVFLSLLFLSMYCPFLRHFYHAFWYQQTILLNKF